MYDENSNNASATSAASSLAAVTSSAPNMAVVSQMFNNKDSRWLQVEVCREFLRGQCARSDQECKFAHPPPHVDVQQGRVTACYDSTKGRCNRENPKCKYLHPPQHIKDQLLINGRNHLALKNLLSAQFNPPGSQPVPVNSIAQIMQQQQQAVAAANIMPNLQYPYYQGLVYSPILQDPYAAAVNQQLQAVLLSNAGLLNASSLSQTAVNASGVAQQLAPSVLALSRKRQLEDDAPNDSHAQLLSLAAAAGGVPCKRPAMDKNGAMLYQSAAQPNQQFNPYLMQSLQGFMPTVSFSGQLPPRY